MRDHLRRYSALYLLLTIFIAHRDAVLHHILQINMFMSRPFDLFYYHSTSETTPGYHIFLAWILDILGYSFVNEKTLALILINLAVGSVSVFVAWLIAKRLSAKPWHAAALVAPIAGSSYVLSSASFVTTDDAAFAFYGSTTRFSRQDFDVCSQHFFACQRLCGGDLVWPRDF
jgi:hypothetical protein